MTKSGPEKTVDLETGLLETMSGFERLLLRATRYERTSGHHLLVCQLPKGHLNATLL